MNLPPIPKPLRQPSTPKPSTPHLSNPLGREPNGSGPFFFPRLSSSSREKCRTELHRRLDLKEKVLLRPARSL